jgi:hypothetical protein
MFDFGDETGSQERFEARVRHYRERGVPVVKHRLLWLLHNNVAHFAMGLYPCAVTFAFHDWTSRKMAGRP